MGSSSTSVGNSSGSSKGGDKAGAVGQGSSSTASTGNGADKAAKNEPKPADGAGKGQQGGQQDAPGSTGPGLLASAASALGTAGRTILLVTHDPDDALRLGGDLVLVADGTVSPPEPSARLLADPPPALRDYLGRPHPGPAPGPAGWDLAQQQQRTGTWTRPG